MIDNNIKQTLCENNKEVLNIIGIINKGYILQKQLIQYMIKLEIVNSEYGARKIITDLEQGEIIKKINFLDTNNQFILLKKFGIRFIKGKGDSQSVGAIRTVTTNRRYYKSILTNDYILNDVLDKNILEYAKKNGILTLLKAMNSNLGRTNTEIYTIFKDTKPRTYQDLKEIEDKKLQSIEKATNAKKAKKNGELIEKVKITKLTKNETRTKLRWKADLNLLQKNNVNLINLSNRLVIWALSDADQNLTESKLTDILIGVYTFTDNLIKGVSLQLDVLLWEENDIKRINKENILKTFKQTTQTTGKNVYLNLRSADMKKNYMGNKLKVAD